MPAWSPSRALPDSMRTRRHIGGPCRSKNSVVVCQAASRQSNKTAIVVGAGIIGLTTTLRLLEHGYDVTCVAENVDGDPNKGVASGGAGGLWFPYLCESTERTGRWANETSREYEDILAKGLGFEEHGVALKKVWQNYSPGNEIPPWAPDFPSFELLTLAQVEERYGPEGPEYDIDAKDFLAYQFEAPIVQVDIFLGYLRDRIAALGGRLRRQRVDGPIEELEGDLLVNCAGLGNATRYEGLEQVRRCGRPRRLHPPLALLTSTPLCHSISRIRNKNPTRMGR